ncbi:MAG: DUF3126 family protein [Alphaproteobacteria bacterium]|nr:DUF3126 family protein [Alphaproteobacteria bacterium]
MALTQAEMEKIQTYLQQLFWNSEIKLAPGQGGDAPAEVFVGKEFIGVIYKNNDDGDISYDWNMSILAEDLEKF